MRVPSVKMTNNFLFLLRLSIKGSLSREVTTLTDMRFQNDLSTYNLFRSFSVTVAQLWGLKGQYIGAYTIQGHYCPLLSLNLCQVHLIKCKVLIHNPISEADGPPSTPENLSLTVQTRADQVGYVVLSKVRTALVLNGCGLPKVTVSIRTYP